MADDLVEIDPSGDVVLVCGHGEDQEASCVLRHASLASPVFKTMLGPNFKEGKQLSGCGTLHLPLPDDDGAQMAIICNTIHLRHNKVPRRLTLTQLSEVAILVDKYDCAMALGPMAEHWVCELKNGSGASSRAGLIYSAYLLRLPTLFRDLSVDELLCCAYHSPKDAPLSQAGPMVEKLIASISGESFLARHKILVFIDRQIVLYTDAGRQKSDNCLRAYEYTMDFLRKLKEVKLWPLSLSYDPTVQTMLQNMESTEWKQETLDDCTYKGKTVNTCFCGSGQAHGSAEIRNRFMGQVKTIRSAMPVACLECTLEDSVWKKADCKHVHDSTSSFGI
ncbi:hypothetical protein Slin14017_G125900 [Septoria linicola]|nr:hypothetical protein Slin14017_G125900 [Septoria linicola]